MLTELPAWKQLEQHHDRTALSLDALFSEDPKRPESLSIDAGPLHIDYSKHLVTAETLELLVTLANECKLSDHIQHLFSGNVVNHSEKKPASHPLLRSSIALTDSMRQTLSKMESISDQIKEKKWKGSTGKIITDVINLGTGGSYLGPLMTTKALSAFSDHSIHLHFIANQHDAALKRLLDQLNPETTLIIISSKSFSTSETLHNFQFTYQWMSASLGTSVMAQHVIAITANTEKAMALGIPDNHIIEFQSDVGGRYSIWTAIGLPLCIHIGFSQFKQFLEGAASIDQHFLNTPFIQNIPVLLGLIEIWYTHFFQAHSVAILPYHQDLSLLPRYLQQLSMESIGKSVNQQGEVLPYPTGSVLWGGVGSTGQHAYHQLLHQGTPFIPCDFITTYEDPFLFAQCLAQSQALMRGHKEGQAAERCPGNRPSTTIILPELTPYSLGALIALYEHKIFAQAIIWGINPFDQWGVEQGKLLGEDLKRVVEYRELPENYDSSTRSLLQRYYQSTKECEDTPNGA